jgi:hypothetical protein
LISFWNSPCSYGKVSKIYASEIWSRLATPTEWTKASFDCVHPLTWSTWSQFSLPVQPTAPNHFQEAFSSISPHESDDTNLCANATSDTFCTSMSFFRFPAFWIGKSQCRILYRAQKMGNSHLLYDHVHVEEFLLVESNILKSKTDIITLGRWEGISSSHIPNVLRKTYSFYKNKMKT